MKGDISFKILEQDYRYQAAAATTEMNVICRYPNRHISLRMPLTMTEREFKNQKKREKLQ